MYLGRTTQLLSLGEEKERKKGKAKYYYSEDRSHMTQVGTSGRGYVYLATLIIMGKSEILLLHRAREGSFPGSFLLTSQLLEILQSEIRFRR
jgi:hypothetical protein